ncbi:MAG: DUF3106 domain-containing protein [Verrucomicrobiota bacterium]
MMRILHTRGLLLGTLACLIVGVVHAKPKTPGEHESRMLMHLLAMDDAELAKVRETVTRIENMSEEERATLRRRLQTLQELTPERRAAIRNRYEAIPKKERDAMRKQWFSMTPEERRNWREKLSNMSEEKRAETLREEGFLPPPTKRNQMDSMRGEADGIQERRGPPPPLR